MGRLTIGLVLTVCLSLALVASASAALRYAAPGGTGVDPCEDFANPCSIFTAAAQGALGTTIQPGDAVELKPGTYTDAAGDLGPDGFVQIAPGVSVGGKFGSEKPLVKLASGSAFYGAFLVGADAWLHDVAIHNESTAGAAVTVNIDGVVEGVVARSTQSSFFTCQVLEGTLRESVCLNESPSSGAALGASSLTFPGTHSVVLRGVTAIATGPGSKGGDFAYFASAAGTNVNVSAKAVLIKGQGTDVVARGLTNPGSPGEPGASTTVNFDHSDYAEAETFTSGTGTAFVTPAGSGDNLTAPPLLEADGYHQLPGSPTVDKGDKDTLSRLFDIDAQWRHMGAAVDIGADELANASRTLVSCDPAALSVAGAKSICTVTVEDAGTASPIWPTGEVAFTTSAGLSAPASCHLGSFTDTASICSIAVVATAEGSGVQTVSATYVGEGNHRGSEGSDTVTVDRAPDAGGGPPPNTLLTKHPPKRTEKRRAKFVFASSEAGSHFECKLDKKPFRPCVSPYKKKVKLGWHRFQVRAVDAEQTPDLSPAAFRWKVEPAS